MIESTLDSNKLLFDDVKHVYWLNGNKRPGVTTIVKAGYPKSEALIKWQIKQGIEEYETGKKAKAAANIGTILHDYAYSIETGKPVHDLVRVIDLHDNRVKILKCIDQFTKWKQENNDVQMASEDIIASVKYNFCGKFDRLAKRNGMVILSDFKTSSGIYPDYFIQLAGYRIAIKEWMGIEVEATEILRFGKDGSFQAKLVCSKKELKEYEKQFIRCLGTYEFRRKYEK